MKKEAIELLQSHRSIRKYKGQPIPDEILQQIYDSLQWAPSSHNVQAYSVIAVKNSEKKAQLAKLCGGQKWVEACPVFLVFCMDYYRLHRVSEMYGQPCEIDEVENLIVGAVDTALAAENALLAARALGLGGVMIGGIRNEPEAVAGILELPSYVVPMMGMCLGYPADEPWQKPRLPQRIVVHEDHYRTEELEAGLQEYEAISADYYTRRTNGRKTSGWTRQMQEYLRTPRRPRLKEFIVKQGFELI